MWQKHPREQSTEPQTIEDRAPWLCRESQEALQTPQPGEEPRPVRVGRGADHLRHKKPRSPESNCVWKTEIWWGFVES